VDGPQDFFGIVDVNVPKDREAQDAHGFLAVHKENDPRVPLALDPREQALPRRLDEPLSEDGLKRRDKEEDPKDISRSHFVFPQ
jgi:hypothetical protein